MSDVRSKPVRCKPERKEDDERQSRFHNNYSRHYLYSSVPALCAACHSYVSRLEGFTVGTELLLNQAEHASRLLYDFIPGTPVLVAAQKKGLTS